DKQTNNFCSSNIVVRDVTKPVIVCPPNTNKAISPQQVQLISGTLTTVNNSANMATLNCFRPLVNPGGGNHFYELYSFTVTKADVFTFELSSTFGDGAALLFDTEVNIQSLCQNVFAQSYQSFTSGVFFTNLNPILRLTARLVPGKTYTLLTTTRAPGATGSYSWAAYSDADGLIININPLPTQAAYDLICTDINQILNKTTSLAFVGTPDVIDNCGVPSANITFTDQLIDGGTCGGNTIVRTFTARDASNNASQCTQLISIRKPTLADVIYPPLTTFLECDSSFPLDVNGNPSPEATGYPFVKTAFGNINLNVTYCTIGASYEDKPRANGCSDTYTLLREWTIADFCNPLNFLVFTQLIQVGDSEAPLVACPTTDQDGNGILDTLVFSTTSTACSATFDVPAPFITDNCSSSTFKVEVISDTLVEVRDEFGFIIDIRLEKFVRATVQSTGSLRVSNIPIGDHAFKYTVTDACGNSTVVECPFLVRDLSEPVVVCKSSITVSLGGDGTAMVFATDVNESSRDNCAIDSILIRRRFTRNPETCDSVAAYWSEWSNAVKMGCCDVGTAVQVEVKVVDKAGNANECVANVEVLDKIKPFCVAPFNVSIPCTSLPKEFNPYDTLTLQSLFGVASASDNCGATWQEIEPIVNLSDCKFGTITRRFRTIDRVGNTSINTCQQVVTITRVNNYEIKFPKDADVQCGTPSADTLVLNRLACDQLSVSVNEERFSAVGNECYRIFRTYRVINFCEYDGVSQPIIIGRDEDCDNAAGDENVWVVRRPGNTFIDRNNVETDNIPAANQRSCTPNNPRGYWRTASSIGYWQYTQIIRVFDTIPPDLIFSNPTPFCATADDCRTQVRVPFIVNETCTPGLISTQVNVDLNADGTSDGTLTSLGGTLSGSYPNFEISGTFVKGKHAFAVAVSDDCGNANTERINFEVVDCKAPAPNCITATTVNLQPTLPLRDVDGDGVEDRGMAVIKATDLISAPVMDCSGPVRYSINRVGQIPNINRDSLIFTCADINIPVNVEIYTWDNASNPFSIQPGGIIGGRNYTRCLATILVKDDALKACAPPKSGIVNGDIRTEDGDPVEGVLVTLSGQSAATTRTAFNGKYGFSQLDEGYDYTVAPLLDTNYVNGVSTIDLIIITKHILGVQPLDSPYKLIAADVNNSKNISTLDLIQMRKLILGIDIVLANNTSWRFVNAAYRFPVQSNPWFEQFPEVYSINDLSGTLGNANFVAIKVGDVNLNAITSQQSFVENRSTVAPFKLRVENQWVNAGATYQVTFEADLSEIQGYQMALNFNTNSLELVGLEHGITQDEHFGWRFLPQGCITTSWHERDATTSNSITPLFTLLFKAKVSGQLSELLSVGAHYTPAEAYDRANVTKPVAIEFYEEQQSQHVELFQNIPNPFTNTTTIGFYLPEPSAATLKVYDANGRLVYIVSDKYNKGYHKIEMERNHLPAGVLYYTLETGNFFNTKRMLLLD
ncbi:MAG: T9SS type A sorting domain-containing protein, partial [Saprospiraceae bacterium]